MGNDSLGVAVTVRTLVSCPVPALLLIAKGRASSCKVSREGTCPNPVLRRDDVDTYHPGLLGWGKKCSAGRCKG